MAARYWVGGTDTWNNTAGTKWAATSGGTGGETVPTSADDVFFDAASGANTVTIGSNSGAKSITYTGFTGTIAGSTAMTVSGNLTLGSGMTYTYSGTVTFNANATIITAGKTISHHITINGAGITVTLGDAYLANGFGNQRTISVSQGKFDTANYTVSCGDLVSGGTAIAEISLGSSQVNLAFTFGINFTNPNLTLNAGTSQIIGAGTNTGIWSTGHTFYNVVFVTGNSTPAIRGGNNTFNNITFQRTSGFSFTIDNTVTVNGTISRAATTFQNRILFRPNVQGISATLNAAAINLPHTDFMDITFAGAIAGSTLTGCGDCGNNSGFNLDAPRTLYRVGTASNWYDNAWSLTSGGSPSASIYPLVQDTAIINDSTTGGSLSPSGVRTSTIDFSNRTTAYTFTSTGGSFTACGSIILSSAITYAGTTTLTFLNSRATPTDFLTAGKTITNSIVFSVALSELRLLDSLNCTSTMVLDLGGVNANGYNLTCTTFTSNNSNTRSIKMGSGDWTLTGSGQIWRIENTITFDKGTANIFLTNNTTTTRQFLNNSNLSYNKLTIGGDTSTSTTEIFGTGSYTEIASTKTVAHTIRLGAAQGTIGTWSVTGTSGNVVTLNSNATGTRRNFTLTNVTSGIDYLSVRDIGELSGNKFYVGANSTNVANNSNVYFTAAPAPVASSGMFFMFN